MDMVYQHLDCVPILVLKLPSNMFTLYARVYIVET
jgi:hypothetical protein